MKKIQQYIEETLGIPLFMDPLSKQETGDLPMYMHELYRLYKAELFHLDFILAEPKQQDEFSILQMDRHFEFLGQKRNKKVILVLPKLESYLRKRLIEKGINFIVPGKQLFLPDLFIDLRESYSRPPKKKQETLLPSTQFLVIYHILSKNKNDWQLEGKAFKEVATKLGYTAMAISKIAEELKYHEIIQVVGEKEKSIRFRLERSELWHDLERRNLWTSPVSKRIYTDVKPEQPFLLYSNAYALPEYTDMNPVMQKYYAIEKKDFSGLQKNNLLVNENPYEGNYCLEVWKYNPMPLAALLFNDLSVVDPLSLYLSLRENHDERIEMAKEQIIEKYIW